MSEKIITAKYEDVEHLGSDGPNPVEYSYDYPECAIGKIRCCMKR